MSQFRSDWAAIAGGAEQIIAKAVDRAKAQIRLPIIGVLMRVFYSSIRAVLVVRPIKTLDSASLAFVFTQFQRLIMELEVEPRNPPRLLIADCNP
jgi:hypothetical protein